MRLLIQWESYWVHYGIFQTLSCLGNLILNLNISSPHTFCHPVSKYYDKLVCFSELTVVGISNQGRLEKKKSYNCLHNILFSEGLLSDPDCENSLVLLRLWKAASWRDN